MQANKTQRGIGGSNRTKRIKHSEASAVVTEPNESNTARNRPYSPNQTNKTQRGIGGSNRIKLNSSTFFLHFLKHSRSASLPTITAGQQRSQTQRVNGGSNSFKLNTSTLSHYFKPTQPVSIASNDHSRSATLPTITAGQQRSQTQRVNGGSNSFKLNTSTVSHYFNHTQPGSSASNHHSRSATLPTITAGQHRFQPSQPVSNAFNHHSG